MIKLCDSLHFFNKRIILLETLVKISIIFWNFSKTILYVKMPSNIFVVYREKFLSFLYLIFHYSWTKKFKDWGLGLLVISHRLTIEDRLQNRRQKLAQLKHPDLAMDDPWYKSTSKQIYNKSMGSEKSTSDEAPVPDTLSIVEAVWATSWLIKKFENLTPSYCAHVGKKY